ncbi:MAG: xanthine dehydrogenase FAD-binding subunit XdhB [Firmicutes bacterium]|nr:xanthine dehydrogenase FAD-binding subunit XdhB [Bacillota bacterium]
MYDIEEYAAAASLADALNRLAARPELKIIAGGSDALLKIRDGKWAGCALLSIHGLPELQGVAMDEKGDIEIRPLTTFGQAAEDTLICRHLPLLAQGAASAGGPQLRRMGTIGGNICNGAPSADTAPALLCLNAVLDLRSAGKSRLLPLNEFYLGPGKTALEAGELLCGVRIAKEDYQGYHGCYYKYSQRRAMDIANISCALWLKSIDNAVADIRLAMGVAAPTPIRLPQTERALQGLPLEQGQKRIANLVRQEIQPRDSWRASREFRLQIAGEIAARCFAAACDKIQGGKADVSNR